MKNKINSCIRQFARLFCAIQLSRNTSIVTNRVKNFHLRNNAWMVAMKTPDYSFTILHLALHDGEECKK